MDLMNKTDKKVLCDTLKDCITNHPDSTIFESLQAVLVFVPMNQRKRAEKFLYKHVVSLIKKGLL